jgi:hypothetical protein
MEHEFKRQISVIWMREKTQDESRIKNARLWKKLHCHTIDFSLIGFDISCRTDVTITGGSRHHDQG